MLTNEYKGTLELIKQEIHSARFHVVRTITREHILLYWKIGKIISEKQLEQGWGKSVVEKYQATCKKNILRVADILQETFGICDVFMLDIQAARNCDNLSQKSLGVRTY